MAEIIFDKRIEEFTRGGRDFMYIDFSGFKKNDDFSALIEIVKEKMLKYEANSVYTVTNIEDIMFNTGTMEILGSYMLYNKPYVKNGAVIGMSSMKKLMLNGLIESSRRDDMVFAADKEEAVGLLLNS